MTFKETIKKCEEFGFGEQFIRETLWNEAYRLGRSRWYWGPSWFVDFTGWINTRLYRLGIRKMPVRPLVWHCPFCGWVVTDVCYMSISFDAPCPRCLTPYSRFRAGWPKLPMRTAS